jgi:hypothetical protein
VKLKNTRDSEPEIILNGLLLPAWEAPLLEHDGDRFYVRCICAACIKVHRGVYERHPLLLSLRGAPGPFTLSAARTSLVTARSFKFLNPVDQLATCVNHARRTLVGPRSQDNTGPPSKLFCQLYAWFTPVAGWRPRNTRS